jgi:hypothetical protein
LWCNSEWDQAVAKFNKAQEIEVSNPLTWVGTGMKALALATHQRVIIERMNDCQVVCIWLRMI